MNKFDAFPTGQERRDAIAKNAHKVEVFKKQGAKIKSKHYSWVDSPLDGLDSREASFFETFEEILPEDISSLGEYVEKALANRKGNAIGVEFGGIGVNAFSGFTAGFFKKSVGMTLYDHRAGFKKFIDVLKKHNSSRHQVLEGDILDVIKTEPSSYLELEKILGGDKIDFIVERMQAGMEFIPKEPYVVGKVLKKWYQLLNDGGIMLVQVPSIFDNVLDEWATLLEDKYKGVLDFKHSKNYLIDGTVFRLRKLAGAPAELPLLNPKDIHVIPIGIGTR